MFFVSKAGQTTGVSYFHAWSQASYLGRVLFFATTCIFLIEVYIIGKMNWVLCCHAEVVI